MAHWVLVKVYRAQTHRTAQHVPGRQSSMTDLSGYNGESLPMDHIGEHVPIQTSFVDFGKE
jgi:hypothetical protein